MPASVKIVITTEGGKETTVEIGKVLAAMQQLGLQTEGVGMLLGQAAQQGIPLDAALQGIGASAGETKQILAALGITTEDVTQKVWNLNTAGTHLRQMFGLGRGSLISLISMLGMGSSAIFAFRRGIESLAEEIREVIKELPRLQRQLDVIGEAFGTLRRGLAETIVEQIRLGRTTTELIDAWHQGGQFLERFAEILEGLGPPTSHIGVLFRNIAEALQGVGEQADYTSESLDRIVQYYEKLEASRAEDTLQMQKRVLAEVAENAEDYADRLILLLQIQGQLPGVIDPTTEALLRQGMALEYAGFKAEWLMSIWKRMLAAKEAMSGMMSDLTQKTYQLGQAQERVGHQMGQAWENFQFRMTQAHESFVFSYEAELESHQMRVWAMTERFNIQMWAAAARHHAAMEAMAKRHAFQIETINQDHLDRLADMEWQHERDRLRMLQQAPWWLQREIQKYQARKARLEEKGDEEGLAKLKKRFRDRIAAIDPVYAKQLDMLEEELEHEQKVEDREWRQRLSRTERMYAIQRELAERNFAISQAQAQAQFAIQVAIEEFRHRERLARLEFQEQQRQESLRHSYRQQVEDLQFGLAQQKETFVYWAEEEMLPEVERQMDKIGWAAINAFKAAIDEGGDFLIRVNMIPIGGPIPPW